MRLFQQPARTPDEVARSRPLDIPHEEIARMDEAAWFARVYRGDDQPQLTVRAVLMGSGLGVLLAFTNVYMGLKTGWGTGVALTACVASFSLWNLALRMRLARTPLSILESNCMQSTAQAAGSSTTGIIVTAIPALLMLSVTPEKPGGTQLPVLILGAWVFFTAVLGVALAVPMKRTLINRERLAFPDGIAAATLQSLYNRGSEALRMGRALFISAGVAALTPLFMDLNLRHKDGERVPLLPGDSRVFDWLPVPGVDPATNQRWKAGDWTMVLDHKLIMVAAGALIGLRVCLSMLAGSLALTYVLGPAALQVGAAKHPGTAWREIGLWLGTPMMVSAGLLSFVFQAGSIKRSFRGLFVRNDGPEPRMAIEVPASWFIAGTGFAGLGIAWLGHAHFQVPWPYGLLAVLMTFFLSLVACRVTGETNINPIGPLGKMVQLTYGVLIPQNATANLMTASISSASALGAADLLTDLKSGYLLGANPRRQYIAQSFGMLSGTCATVFAWYLLVPDATFLNGTATRGATFPAPAAQMWKAVAQAFRDGIEHLHPMARQLIVVGFVVGTVYALLEGALAAWAPRARAWLPSIAGFGMGIMFPFQYPFSMLLGALAAWQWRRRNLAHAERYVVPIASGITAGESVSGVVVAAINNLVLK